jgi:hypothetical protein
VTATGTYPEHRRRLLLLLVLVLSGMMRVVRVVLV